ncbi:VCBS repeat-containing protein [Streptomyces sp. NPDC051018]|uniref:VCBS repeat-containing protein n=1 Tax=Streptomyces sp. NPDC051018 TaxID=3365639 RepID=UPI0037B3B5A8
MGGVDTDFNGDGLRDTAIADPEATVSGQRRAGLIRVVLGGGKGVVEVSQDMPNVSDSAEAGDGFGFSFAVYDADLDGCSDLAVGIPHEDVDTVEDAGLVHLVHGSTLGIGLGKKDVGFAQGASRLLHEVPEKGDLVGYSVATTVSATGHPYLIIGTPGEDLPSGPDTGLVNAVQSVAFDVATITQDSPGVWETAEAHDRFGYSVAAAGNWFTVGVPGESIGPARAAGAISVFKASIDINGIPAPAWGSGQARNGVGDSHAEAGDGYGTSVAMAAHRTTTTTPPGDALIAAGVPGEDLGSIADAGGVQIGQVTWDSRAVWHSWITQDSADMEAVAEAGDRFGQSVVAANTSPVVVGTAATMRLAAGAPGEDSGTGVTDTGGVGLLPLLGAPGVSDVWLEAGDGIPAEPADHLLAGLNLGTAGGTAVLVGLPYAKTGDRAVHSYPWTTGGGGSPAGTWKPGQGGIPADNAAFGTAIR